jgi:Na+-exporting ATPase
MNRLAYLLLGLAIVTAIVVVATTAFTNVPLTIATYAVATVS